jgi:glycosyltransferase involved in cell wall biosynthesis
MQARANPFDLQVIKQERFHHISDGPWLVDELSMLGLEVEYEPLTAVRPGGPVKPFPPQFRVLTYLPEPRRDFYGADLVYRVAKAMPGVQFTVVGNGGRSPEAPSNVVFCGYVDDMQQRIDDSTVLLRVPQHDGKSMLVLEALARARHVVWNYEFPHVRTAQTEKEIFHELNRFRKLHAEGKIEPNYEGREFVLRNFARAQTAARFEERLDRAVAEQRLKRSSAKRCVAISGLGLFCGDIAEHARSVTPEWDTRLLRTNSRLELLTAIVGLSASDVWYSIGSAASDGVLHRVARVLRKPRVIHWVGSDIVKLRQDPRLQALLSGPNVTHLAEVAWTAEELRVLGFNARIAPLPSRLQPANGAKLPEQFTVLFYVPRTRSDFYGRRQFERLMRSLRDKPIRYLIVGGGHLRVPHGVDAEDFGWRGDLADIYKQATALIRFTPRDGLSLMVLEALSFGRHVLWTQPFPYVRRVGTFKGMEDEICSLFDLHERGELHAQKEAADFVRRQYAADICMKTIAQAWDDAANPHVRTRLAGDTP